MSFIDSSRSGIGVVCITICTTSCIVIYGTAWDSNVSETQRKAIHSGRCANTILERIGLYLNYIASCHTTANYASICMPVKSGTGVCQDQLPF